MLQTGSRMNVVVTTTRSSGTDQRFREDASARTEDVLATFESHIRDVIVSIVDVNPDRAGEEDKVCRLMIRTIGGGPTIMATGRAPSFWQALNSALRRARRQLRERADVGRRVASVSGVLRYA